MTGVSGITRMNIASADDEELAKLHKFFAEFISIDPAEIERAAEYLAAVEHEIDLRTRELM